MEDRQAIKFSMRLPKDVTPADFINQSVQKVEELMRYGTGEFFEGQQQKADATGYVAEYPMSVYLNGKDIISVMGYL